MCIRDRLKALEKGDMKMIEIALKDKLHQKYRGSLIHEDVYKRQVYDI